MNSIHTIKKNNESGFALLLTLVVVSVILAIGLSLLHITLKQFTLSSIARDSEVAFHTAHIGMECMRYQRSQPLIRADFLDGGAAPNLVCAGVSDSSRSDNHYTVSGQNVHNYRYTYTVGNNSDLCTETSIYLMDNEGGDNEITYTANEGLGDVTCPIGAMCTIIFARGYNRPCDKLNSILTVQRELTVVY